MKGIEKQIINQIHDSFDPNKKSSVIRFQRTVSRSNHAMRNNLSPKKCDDSNVTNLITYIKPTLSTADSCASTDKSNQSIIQKLSKFSQKDYQFRKAQQNTTKNINISHNLKQNLSEFKYLQQIVSHSDKIDTDQAYRNLKFKYDAKVKQCQLLERLVRQKDNKICQQLQQLKNIKNIQVQMTVLWKAVDDLQNEKVKNLKYINELQQLKNNKKISIQKLKIQIENQKNKNRVSEPYQQIKEKQIRAFYENLLDAKNRQLENADLVIKQYALLLEEQQIRLKKNNIGHNIVDCRQSPFLANTLNLEDNNLISKFQYSLTPQN